MARRSNHPQPTATLTLQHFSKELGKWVSADPVVCFGDEELQKRRLKAYAKSHKEGLKTRILHETRGVE